MTTYTSIQQGDHDSNNDTDSLTRPTTSATSTTRMSNKHKTLLGGFVTVVAGLAVITTGTGTGTDNSNSIVTLDSATSATAAVVVVATAGVAAAVVVRDCTFTECFASPCDKKLAPFVCELWNGGPMGGCSPTPWLVDTCDDSCSLAQCHLLPIPPTTKTCQDVQCGEDGTSWCDSPQLCGEDTPYQCMNGSGRFGCSALPLQWTLLSSDTTCADCCDITTCEGCRTSKWYLSYLASNNGSGSDAAVCVEKYYTEEASMVANAEHLQQINPTTLALQQGVRCQDRTEVDYSHLLKQYVPPKKETTTYGNCWIKHFSNEE
mmetsp:Transcript_23394/g.26862  ORF Transcript_23394/g.26862 Transcript_23394/m.26862 type:complete len:319 (-) Transcript_23394:107-1063(-)